MTPTAFIEEIKKSCTILKQNKIIKQAILDIDEDLSEHSTAIVNIENEQQELIDNMNAINDDYLRTKAKVNYLEPFVLGETEDVYEEVSIIAESKTSGKLLQISLPLGTIEDNTRFLYIPKPSKTGSAPPVECKYKTIDGTRVTKTLTFYGPFVDGTVGYMDITISKTASAEVIAIKAYDMNRTQLAMFADSTGLDYYVDNAKVYKIKTKLKGA